MEDKTLREAIDAMDRAQWAVERRSAERLAKEKEKLFLPTQRTKLVRDNILKVKMERGPITDSRKARSIFAEFFRDMTVEVAAIMALNVHNEYLGMGSLGQGSFDRVHIDPMEVFGRVWSYQAAGFIIAHNHPSGNVEPSGEDMEMLRELRGLGIALNRPMRDFMIIGFEEDGTLKYYSHRDSNYEL